MEAIAGGRRLTADEYLLLWLGAFGKCVGLDVPLALARELDSLEQNMD
jgi:ubiquitin-like-conjugating enzyme ATG10